MLKFVVALCAGELASVTFTVNDAVPAVVGVPLICPALLSVNPAGNEPDEIDQLYGVVPPLAASVAVYAVPTVPPLSDVVVTCTGVTAAATTMLKLFVVLCAGELESVTFKVNDAVPAVVGVPLICPALLSVSPAGNAPEEIDQLYGVVPPLAASVAVYAVPTWPPLSVEVVICTGVTAAAITMLKFAVALCAGELESVTFTVNDAVPAAVGVPLICPALLSVNPAGNEPEEIDQLYGVVPPLAAKDAVYAAPTVPLVSDDVVMTGGCTAAFTVSVAALLVTLPVELLTTTSKVVPLWEVVVAAVV